MNVNVQWQGIQDRRERIYEISKEIRKYKEGHPQRMVLFDQQDKIMRSIYQLEDQLRNHCGGHTVIMLSNGNALVYMDEGYEELEVWRADTTQSHNR